MILGVEKVVNAVNAEPGKFYMCESWSSGATVLLCVLNRAAESENDRKLALIFTTNGMEDIRIGGFPSDVLVEIGPVAVRVDPPSLSGSSFTTTTRQKMLIVKEDHAIVIAPVGDRSFGYVPVDITAAEVIERKGFEVWASFERWSLVTVDGGEELEIASFSGI